MPRRSEPGGQQAEDPLTKKIANWLIQQGVPLELRTLRDLRDAGFTTVERGSWIQTERPDGSRVWRETDVSATEFLPLARPDNHFTIVHQIECTESASHPWVVLPGGTPNDFSRAWHGRLWSRRARCFPEAVEETLVNNTGDANDVDPPPLLNDVGEWVSGVTETLRSRPKGRQRGEPAIDSGYAKVQQVLDAARSITKQLDTQERWGLVLPVVVIGTELYRATLGPDGEVHVSKTNGHATLCVERWSTDEPSVLVDIVTAAAFPDLAKRRYAEVNEAISSFPGLAKRSRELEKIKANQQRRIRQAEILSEPFDRTNL